MITSVNALTPLMLCIFVLLFLGVAVFAWGKKLPARGSWLIWAGLLAVITGEGLDTGLFLKEEFRNKIWMVGWIWPRDEVNAITVGVFQDSLSYAMITLVILTVAILLMNQTYLFREPRPERSLAALAISAAGVACSWNSLTPWLALGGLALTVVGGFLSFGSRWDSNSEAKSAARFAYERGSGFLLAFFGACILASSRPALLFNQSESWMSGSSLASTWVGSSLLVLGLFVQLQPFPLLGALVSSSEVCSPLGTLLNQVFPAWAAFALLVRATPHFATLGLFNVFGWVALGSTLLTVLSGLFQERWRQVLGIWLSAGFSLSCAVLGLSGPLPATGIFLGVSLGALCLSIAATSLECAEFSKESDGGGEIWIKIALFLGGASGTGALGFISATGGLRWVSQAVELAGGIVAIFLFVFFFFVLLGWKVTWSINKLGVQSTASWLTILSLFICLLLSLGFVWTGSLTGGVLLGASDKFVSSGFEIFFGSKAAEILHPEDFLYASSLYWGVLIFAFIAAYWMSGRREDRWAVLSRMVPKTSQFLSYGYGIDRIAQQVMSVVSAIGKFSEHLVDNKIWNFWVPNGLYVGIRTLAGTISSLDRKLSKHIGSSLRTMVDVPAKLLQLIQIGDVRWYLFFALSSGFALLSHYLKM